MPDKTMTADLLKQPVDIRLSVSDWLLLLGWASAHVNESTSELTVAAIREIGKQVQA